jgi:hypothetical protein
MNTRVAERESEHVRRQLAKELLIFSYPDDGC